MHVHWADGSPFKRRARVHLHPHCVAAAHPAAHVLLKWLIAQAHGYLQLYDALAAWSVVIARCICPRMEATEFEERQALLDRIGNLIELMDEVHYLEAQLGREDTGPAGSLKPANLAFLGTMYGLQVYNPLQLQCAKETIEYWFRQRRGKLTASNLGQEALAAQLRQDTKPPEDADKPPGEQKKRNQTLAWGTKKEPCGVLEYVTATGSSSRGGRCGAPKRGGRTRTACRSAALAAGRRGEEEEEEGKPGVLPPISAHSVEKHASCELHEVLAMHRHRARPRVDLVLSVDTAPNARAQYRSISSVRRRPHTQIKSPARRPSVTPAAPDPPPSVT
ncbi:hypothetical protein T492DRAFT_854033 [Pavlovales sp. CCMP2436]|nr:hypothetical protein T492DRAFT_854033 [Pavlovales sp. CCMP2436]